MTELWRCHWCGEIHAPDDLVLAEEDGLLLCPRMAAGDPQVAWRPEWQAEDREHAAQIAQAMSVADQMAQIRAIFDTFDWETDDRQYALEQIEDILRNRP